MRRCDGMDFGKSETLRERERVKKSMIEPFCLFSSITSTWQRNVTG